MNATDLVTSTGLYRFKDITTVPDAKSLVDIVLSQTQRRTPTQVHPQFKISRIRNFYMRKVKYCQQTFHDKFTSILTEFPRLDDIHPFYSDLCNVLYDRDHYKLALGQLNVVRGVVDRVAKDYVRLLKYSDSPYKCKMLKRAALGRMCTAVRKLGDSLKYLEEVRQHLSRLPSINPNTRTLLLTGYPNVGKSSFINLITNANVEVQPYAFTTKSLFVGHFDYDYIRWQAIDTPGILDHPLSNRNTIELTAITALAHIQAAILFFIDISEQCGFSIEKQVSLFHSIKVLFKNKPLVIVLNKIDIMNFDHLPIEKQELINEMKNGMDHVTILQSSCLTLEGVDAVKNAACSLFETNHLENQMISNRTAMLKPTISLTKVKPPASRPPHIPESILKERQRLKDDTNSSNTLQKVEEESFRTLRQIEEENGGAGVFSIDLNSEWNLKNEEWKYDIMPEIFQGKNIADFIDPEIEEKLKKLEEEEDKLLEESNMMEVDESEWEEIAKKLRDVHKKIKLKQAHSKLLKNHAHKIMPITLKPPKRVDEAVQKLSKLGYDITDGISVIPSRSLPHKTKKSLDDDVIMEDTNDALVVGGNTFDTPSAKIRSKLAKFSQARTKSYGTSPFAQSVKRIKKTIPNRITKGLPTESLFRAGEKVRRKREEGMKRMRKAGEADRFIGTKMPRHLYSGKRKKGKTDRR